MLRSGCSASAERVGDSLGLEFGPSGLQNHKMAEPVTILGAASTFVLSAAQNPRVQDWTAGVFGNLVASGIQSALDPIFDPRQNSDVESALHRAWGQAARLVVLAHLDTGGFDGLVIRAPDRVLLEEASRTWPGEEFTGQVMALTVSNSTVPSLSAFLEPEGQFVERLVSGLRHLDEPIFLVPGFERRIRSTLLGVFQHELVEVAIKRDDRSRRSLMFALMLAVLKRLESDAQDPTERAGIEAVITRFDGLEDRLLGAVAAWRADLRDLVSIEVRRGTEGVAEVISEKTAEKLALRLAKEPPHGWLRPGESSAPLPVPDGAPCLQRDSLLGSFVKHACTMDARWHAVVGPPGVGKSTLTLAMAHHPDTHATFGSRRFFVQCDGVSSAEALRISVAVAAGMIRSDALRSGSDAEVVYRAAVERMGGQRSLLILDNAEISWQADPEGVDRLFRELAGIESLTLVASFQGAEPFGSITWNTTTVAPLPDVESSRSMFERYAGKRIADSSAARQFLAELGGLPLAIMLAGKAYALEPDEGRFLKRWQHLTTRLDVLAPQGIHIRNLSLAASVGLSLAALSSGASRLVRALAMLPQGLDRDLVHTVLPGVSDREVQAVCKRGLAERFGAARVRMLPPVRDCALSAGGPRSDEVDRQVSEFFLTLALVGETVGTSDNAGDWTRLANELGNCSSIAERSLQNGAFVRESIRAALALAYYGRFTGVDFAYLLNIARMQSVLNGDRALTAACDRRLGEMWLGRHDPHTAHARYKEALTVFTELQDQLSEASCLVGLGRCLHAQADMAGAKLHFDRALHLYQLSGDTNGQAICVRQLGTLRLEASDTLGALLLFEQALGLCPKGASDLAAAHTMKQIADVLVMRREYAKARAAYRRARRLYRSLGYPLAVIDCAKGRADILAQERSWIRARRIYECVAVRYKAAGVALGEANCTRRLGDIRFHLGDLSGACELYEDALESYRRLKVPKGEANCIRNMAGVHLERGELAQAALAFEMAKHLYQQQGNLSGEASCMRGLGDVQAARLDPKGAKSNYVRALKGFRRTTDIEGEVECLLKLGRLALTRSSEQAGKARVNEASEVSRKAGYAFGELRCAIAMAEIAIARGDTAEASALLAPALVKARQIGDWESVGEIATRLARYSNHGIETVRHIEQARHAWKVLQRPDRLERLEAEFHPNERRVQ